MNADNWLADSGIDVRQLVWGFLSVANAFEAETEDEEAVVEMLMLDGRDFIEKTEPSD